MLFKTYHWFMATHHGLRRAEKARRHMEKLAALSPLRPHERAFAANLGLGTASLAETKAQFRQLVLDLREATAPNDLYVRYYAAATLAEIEGDLARRDEALRFSDTIDCHSSLRGWLPLGSLRAIADEEAPTHAT